MYGGDGNDHLHGNHGDDVLYGGPGNDHLKGGKANDILFGQGGNDRLQGGVGDDILTGGDGDDRLDAGSGRNVLIGGRGVDVLIGKGGSDGGSDGASDGGSDGGQDSGNLLIGGFTTYDDNPAALDAILAEWSSNSDYATRVNNLRTGSGPTLGGVALEAGVTVFDDDARDKLKGSRGRDWFFADLDGLDNDDDLLIGSKLSEWIELL